MLETAGRPGIGPPGVVYVVRRAVRRAERLANEKGIKLTH